MPDVLVVGDANVDIIVPFPKFLDRERTRVEYPQPCLQGGGTCANTAAALGKLGLSTLFWGSVGNDQYGRYILDDLARAGIRTDQIIIDPHLNTVAVFAFIDEFGERYLWGWPRERQAFKELDLARLDLDRVRAAAWVHSSGMALAYDSSARYTVITLLRAAREAGVPTSFDVNLRLNNGTVDSDFKQAVLRAIEYSSFVLGSGDDEFRYLGTGGDWRAVAAGFATSTRTVVVRMGADGSMGITPQRTIHAPAFDLDVVDTVGAGDVYNAGFIAAMLRGGSLHDALLAGNGVAGYSVTHPGARHTPDRRELQTFLKRTVKASQ